MAKKIDGAVLDSKVENETAKVENETPMIENEANQDVFEETVNSVFLGRQTEGKRAGTRAVKWDRLYADYDFNIRDKSINYSATSLSALRDLLNMEGQKEPLTVSLQSDGRLKIIKGHRRHACMTLDRNDDLAVDPSGKHKVEPENVRWQYVLVDIKKDMSTEDEIVEMLDHGGRKGLSTVEMFDAILRLRALGGQWTSETRVLTKLGLDKTERGKGTNHFKMATMPKELHQPYREWLNKESTATIKFPAPVINELYSAMTKDRKENPTKLTVGGGPEFKAKWEEVKVKGGNVKSKAQSVKTVVEQFRNTVVADGHQLLIHLANNLLGETEDVPKLEDVLGKIVLALNEFYPPVEEEINREV